MKEGYIKKKGKTIPFGYEESDIENYCKPIPHELEVLKKYLEYIKEQTYSLRQASVLIEEETGRKLSHVSLKNYLDKGPSLEERRKNVLKKKKVKLDKQKLNLRKQENTLKKEQDVIKKITENTNSKVITEDELESSSVSIQETIKESKVFFHANEGPQTDFLAAGEKDVFTVEQLEVVSLTLCLLTHYVMHIRKLTGL